MSEEIKKYEVNYFAGGQSGDNYPYKATIKLRRGDGTLIGVAHFYKDRNDLPACDTINKNEQYHCHYHISDYANVLDILRNEKPVFFDFLGGKWNMGSIATTSERVGEGE